MRCFDLSVLEKNEPCCKLGVKMASIHHRSQFQVRDLNLSGLLRGIREKKESSRGFVAECNSRADDSLKAKVQTVQLMTAVASQLHLSEQDDLCSAQDLALY